MTLVLKVHDVLPSFSTAIRSEGLLVFDGESFGWARRV